MLRNDLDIYFRCLLEKPLSPRTICFTVKHAGARTKYGQPRPSRPSGAPNQLRLGSVRTKEKILLRENALRQLDLIRRYTRGALLSAKSEVYAVCFGPAHVSPRPQSPETNFALSSQASSIADWQRTLCCAVSSAAILYRQWLSFTLLLRPGPAEMFISGSLSEKRSPVQKTVARSFVEPAGLALQAAGENPRAKDNEKENFFLFCEGPARN